MNEEYEKCTNCKQDLLEEPIDLDVGVVYSLLFCVNDNCPRYLLFTNTPSLFAPQSNELGGSV